MAKAKREIIFATFIISCIATVLTIVSIATNEWIVSDLKLVIEPTKKGYVSYGLFNGVFENRVVATPISNNIAVACIFSENICGFSSAITKERRESELKDILDGKFCVKKKTATKKEENASLPKFFVPQVHEAYDDTSSTTEENVPDACDLRFLNTGFWLTTIILMMLSTLFGGISAFFSVINTSTNPINQWHSIWGLYIWNGISCGSHLLAMILWGAHFESYIKYNVAISETLTGVFKSEGLTSLGYSYWIIFPAMILHLANIGLFYLRQYLINKEPEIPTVENIRDKDGMIFVY